MPKKFHAVVTREQFLESYLKDLPEGGLFLQTEEIFHVGDELLLSLEMAGLREVMDFRGEVAWHRRPRAWSTSLPSGIGFRFHNIEAPRRDFLLSFAEGKVNDRRRAGPRQNAQHESRLRIHGTWVSAKIVNLGAGGVMLVAEEKLERGATLPCMVYLDGDASPSECSVQVERVEKEDSTYIAGARFLRLPPGLRQAFEEMPVATFPARETRAQQIIKRSTFPPPRPITGSFPIGNKK